MPVAVVTRTVMAHPGYFVPFMWGSLRAAVQARNTPGYLAGAVAIDAEPTFWILTLWRDGHALTNFRDRGIHAELMPRLADWAREGMTAAWRTDSERRPTWAEARQRLRQNPRFLDVSHPRPAPHDIALVRPERTTLALPIPPRRSS